MSDFIIREATADDALQTLRLVRNTLAEPDTDLLTMPWEFTIGVEEEARWLQQHLDAENSTVLVAEANGEIIALMNSTGSSHYVTQHVTRIGVAVRADWRGKGVGSALLQYLIEWARGTGIIRRIELDVLARNARAIHVYEKFGFQVEGRQRDAIYKDRQYHDLLLMALLIEDAQEEKLQ